MALLPYDENKIQEHSLGLMSEICESCRALYFSSEKSFHNCCMEGKYLLFRFIICKNCEIMYPQTKVIDMFGLCQNCAKKMPKLFLTDKDKDFFKLRSLSRKIIPSVQRIKTLLCSG